MDSVGTEGSDTAHRGMGAYWGDRHSRAQGILLMLEILAPINLFLMFPC